MTTEPEPATPPAAASTDADEPRPLNDVSLPFPLQKSEQVLAVVRRHWWFLWPRTLLFAAFGIGAPLVVWWVLDLINLYDNVESWYWIAAGLWMLFWLIRIGLNWYQYYNDIWVITNQRIVDSLKPHPLRHTLSTADLVNIQDMTVETRGITARILGYGNVVCDTAGSGRRRAEFVLRGIPKPAEVQLMVDAERDRERRGTR